MNHSHPRWRPGNWGVWAALGSAFLFGASTPLAKSLLNQVNPWMLAGLLYLGSGLGLGLYQLLRGAPAVRLSAVETRWLLLAALCGGGIAPVLLMYGLSGMAASHVALLLNAEAVLTSLLAWAVFKENLGKRLAIGMLAIVAGALLLSWPENAQARGLNLASLWPALAVLLACMFWALDNNFTRKVALADAAWLACIKGMVAGSTNLLLAFVLGAVLPDTVHVGTAMLLGFFAYGVSLALFIVGLRHVGASRAGAYFSTAPFVGALSSVLFLGEPMTWQLLAAAALMAVGIWLHLTEHHAHAHRHAMLEHAHSHTHGALGEGGEDGDGHHLHDHKPAVVGTHAHFHRHEPQVHSHAHYPDAHHRHRH